jgi:hypothetical protein
LNDGFIDLSKCFTLTFNLVLCRAESDGVGMEDVETLQVELEAMLAAAVVKKRAIAEEVKILQGLEKYKGTSAAAGKSANKRVRERKWFHKTTICQSSTPLHLLP